MAKPRFQFSIRALLIGTLLAAIGLLVWLNLPANSKDDKVNMPPDIEAEVLRLFTDPDSQQEVLAKIKDLHEGGGLNVGASQLSRAILVLSDGDLSEFKRWASIPADPRDIINGGERKLGNPRHWFGPPIFDAARTKTMPSKVELAKDDFPESGYEMEDYGREVHYWKTKTGHLFSAWVGGNYKRTGNAFIWSVYHSDSEVHVRLRQNDVLGDWIKMHPDKGETEQRVLQKSFAKGRVGIQFRADDQVFDEVFINGSR